MRIETHDLPYHAKPVTVEMELMTVGDPPDVQVIFKSKLLTGIQTTKVMFSLEEAAEFLATLDRLLCWLLRGKFPEQDPRIVEEARRRAAEYDPPLGEEDLRRAREHVVGATEKGVEEVLGGEPNFAEFPRMAGRLMMQALHYLAVIADGHAKQLEEVKTHIGALRRLEARRAVEAEDDALED